MCTHTHIYTRWSRWFPPPKSLQIYDIFPWLLWNLPNIVFAHISGLFGLLNKGPLSLQFLFARALSVTSRVSKTQPPVLVLIYCFTSVFPSFTFLRTYLLCIFAVQRSQIAFSFSGLPVHHLTPVVKKASWGEMSGQAPSREGTTVNLF